MTDFISVLSQYFSNVPDYIELGKLVRFATDINKPNKRDGWYKAFNDNNGRVIKFGTHREGEKHTWCDKSGIQTLSREERIARRREFIKNKQIAAKKLIKQHNDVAILANKLYYDSSVCHFNGDSQYLKRKKINPPYDLRFIKNVDTKIFGFQTSWLFNGIAIPIRNYKGKIRSFQLIDDNSGNKYLIPSGETEGNFFNIGFDIKDINKLSHLIIAEGLATAQSCTEVTKIQSVVAFSCHNLKSVAVNLRKVAPGTTFIFAVDGDDAGRTHSKEAALVVGNSQLVYAPDGKDFNDVPIDLSKAVAIEPVQQIVSNNQNSTVATDSNKNGIQEIAVNQDDDNLWRGNLLKHYYKDKPPKIYSKTYNINLILTNDKYFRGRIRLNELSEQIYLDDNPITDTNFSKIKQWLEQKYITDDALKNDDLEKGILTVAYDNKFNPLRDYLESLEWNGNEVIETFFFDYLGCEFDDYHRTAAICLFISAVKRVYEPGCQVDTMTIFEGIQGVGKTQLCKALAGDENYTDLIADINNKDFFLALHGKWFCDFGELDQFSKADVTRIKQIISMTTDRVRPPYGRFTKDLKRSSIFVGGTNRDDWNKDATGGRRYIPVRVMVPKIDIEAVKGNRDQLWAEAVYAYKTNKFPTWWEVTNAKEEQEARYVGDVWDNAVSEYLNEKIKAAIAGERPQPEFDIADILENCIKMPLDRQDRSAHTRLGNIMISLGYEKRRVRRDDKRIHVYVKK